MLNVNVTIIVQAASTTLYCFSSSWGSGWSENIINASKSVFTVNNNNLTSCQKHKTNKHKLKFNPVDKTQMLLPGSQVKRRITNYLRCQFNRTKYFDSIAYQSILHQEAYRL